MGIRKKIKKRLPIFGRKTEAMQNSVPTPSPSVAADDVSQEVTMPEAPRGGLSAREYIEKILEENKIVIFMKGSPEQPLCGFSANASQILASYGKPFAHVDVIADYEVREEIKDFSRWPTLPQIYINKEFLGGSDILREMDSDGSLKTQIMDAFSL